jgi:hypothetical protein
MRRRTAFLSMGLFLGVMATPPLSRAEDPVPADVAGTTAPAAEPYLYEGDKHRDPFLPLTGGVMMTATSDHQPFKAANVELTGILRSKTGRWAALRSNNGELFIVKNGKILDSKRKEVEGHVGIIKEKTLVIIGPDNQVTELKLKRDQEAKNP